MKYGKIYDKILLLLVIAIPILLPIQHSSGVSSCPVSTYTRIAGIDTLPLNSKQTEKKNCQFLMSVVIPVVRSLFQPTIQKYECVFASAL